MNYNFKAKSVYCLIMVLAGTFPLFWQGCKRSEGKVNPVRPPAKMVALTFDDGPNPTYTRQILEILHKYQVKATFFMIGANARKYPEVVHQVVAEGHALGNHTETHPRNLAACSPAQIHKELRDCQATIRRIAGLRVYIFRPPRGKYDRKVVQIARRNGYQTVLWSVCGDKDNPKNPRIMARQVLRQIRPGDIILLHDGDLHLRWKDVVATRYIVEGLHGRGFQFITIPQLLKQSVKNSRFKALIR